MNIRCRPEHSESAIRNAVFTSAFLVLFLCSSTAQAQWKLGVTIVDVDPRPHVPGVLIESVGVGTPATVFGIEPQDVIHEINGRMVFTVADVRQAIAASQGRVEILIRDWRTGRMVRTQVPLMWTDQRPTPPPPRFPNNLAQDQVDIITRALGMTRIPTYPAPVPDAEASMMRDQFGRMAPVIRYNVDFLNRLYREHGQWASISVLVHEVAHHFNGDSTFYGAFTHQWTKELKADFVSGYVLAKAGASQDQALRAIKDGFTHFATISHPDTPTRIAAISAGWRKGRFGG